MGVAMGLCERREAEAGRRTAEIMGEKLEQEKQLRELKDRFVSLTPMEFRPPLATILSSASLLEMAADRMTPEKRMAHYRKIQSTVRNMNLLLEDVLTLSKAEADKLEFDPAPLDLEAFCRDITEEIGQTVYRSHHFEFSSPVKPSPPLLTEQLLHQLLNTILPTTTHNPP